MPLTGEAKRARAREYQREKRAQGRQVRRAVEAVVNGHRGRPPGVKTEAQVAALRSILDLEGVTLTRLVKKVGVALDFKRPWGDHEEPLMCEDGDAQLRAVDLGLRLHERAGTIPSERAQAGGGNSITVIEVIYAPHHGNGGAEGLQSPIERVVSECVKPQEA